MHPSVIYLFARMLLGIGIVVGIMALLARFVQRRRSGAGGPGSARHIPPVKVVARHTLAKGSHLVLVAVGEQTLVLGLTSSGVSLLDKYKASPDGAPTGRRAHDTAGETDSIPLVDTQANHITRSSFRDICQRAGTSRAGRQTATGSAIYEDDITNAAKQILARSDIEGQGRPPLPTALGLRRSAWTATLEQLRELTLRRS